MMIVIVHVHFKWRAKCISLVVTLDLILNEIILLLHLLWILVDYQIFQLGFHSEDVLLMARDPRTTRNAYQWVQTRPRFSKFCWSWSGPRFRKFLWSWSSFGLVLARESLLMARAKQ